MSEKSVLAVRPGAVNQKDRAALREAGIVVIEVDDPANVRFLTPSQSLESDDLLYAAMRGLNAPYASDSSKALFVKILGDILESNRHAPEAVKK